MSGVTNHKSKAEYLHLTLHLVNGGRQQFVQTETETANHLLDHFRPERLFAQKQVLLQGDDSVTILPTENIERIDLRSEPLPVWTHTEFISSIEEITEEDFLRILRREQAAPRKVLGRAVPAPPSEIGAMAELRSGKIVYLSVRRKPPIAAGGPITPPTPDDLRLLLQHMFTRPVLFGAGADGQSLFLLNPANVLRYTLTPTPPETVAGAGVCRPRPRSGQKITGVRFSQKPMASESASRTRFPPRSIPRSRRRRCPRSVLFSWLRR